MNHDSSSRLRRTRTLLAGTRRIAAVVGLSLAAVGCHSAEEEQAKISAIQKEANDKVQKAQHDADEKVQALQKQIEQMRQDMSDAAAKLKAEADDAVSKAQASAEEQAKAAEAALTKARQAFKEEGRIQLAQLNKDVGELSGKSAKASAKVKSEVQKAMKQIATQQKNVAKDIAAFDSATIDSLKKTKAKLDQDLAQMKATVRGARAKVP